MPDFDRPRLIADIGGSYARFALETAPGRFEHIEALRCDAHAVLQSAIGAYLDMLPPGPRILQAGLAVATPVDGDQVRMTNSPWQFSIEALRKRLGLDALVVVNDFTALAMAVPRLQAEDLMQIGGGQADATGVIGLLGSGSGLGASGLIPAAEGWIALGAEGGHASFAPCDEREIALLRHAWRQFGHVSFERLLSGPGLVLIRQALADLRGQQIEAMDPAEITAHALAASDVLCIEVVDTFCTLLGTAAANLALTLGARGGIYLGGGIVPRLGALFARSDFRRRFEDKGRFSAYLAAIPTFVITSEHATLLGASAILDARLRELGSGQAAAILDQIQRVREQLSPAELRVAEHVLAHARAVLNAPIAEIARAAAVSQPTVIRFCRSLGCEGLSDFKLRLASGLSGTVPVTHTHVTREDSMLELGAKVLGNTASAILQARSQLNRDSVERAIERLLRARRVECFALGPLAIVAQDAQHKLLRLGLPCGAHTEASLQPLTADLMGVHDVALIISACGQRGELVEVADKARARGATVIAIAASQSALARKADVALIVEPVEDIATQLPMINRILHLMAIDILSVGVAMRQHSPALSPPPTPTPQPLAHLSSHSR